MRNTPRLNLFLRIVFVAALAVEFLFAGSEARAQVSGGTDVNVSQMQGDQVECAIAKNPSNKNQLFILCNSNGAGLFAARSADSGVTWSYPDPADKTIADGNPGQGPAACCDPSLAWDTFGNLFITYVDSSLTTIVTILSTDGGLTFSNLASFGPFCVQCADQPTVVAANTTAPGAPVAVWIVWHQLLSATNPNGPMLARGAAVTGLGVGGVGAFTAQQAIPGTTNCSYGDVVISPSGVVVQACQNPSAGSAAGRILVNTKADGLGPNPFGAAVVATTTNVGAFDFIPPQSVRSVDAEAGLTFDSNPMSPHFGRLYLVYTDETAVGSGDTDIMLRVSDDNGGTWSAPARVNDDPPGPVRSQFFPKIALNTDSGNIAICWYDCRNSATNTAMQVFCTIANRNLFPAFIGGNVQISEGASTSNGSANEFGDYAGLAYFKGFAHPAWADSSNSGGLNPNGTSNFDAYTDRVSGGLAAMEGDPHVSTVDGIHYDFQSAGEFVVLRDAGGTEIQTRQTAVPTASVVGNAYTGLTTCVSLNTAVAVRVNKHRVTFEPNLSGEPDPSGLQLRVDGNLTTLPSAGLDLGAGGRVVSSLAGGIQVGFPDETTLIVTPNWWSTENKWYLNVDVYHSAALEGVMGARARGSWLPALADGTSLGPKPAALHQRYVDLYQKFADSWRVTDKTSLFDYAPGTSTATFTIASWPPENPPCVLPETTPVKPATLAVARRACRAVVGKNRKEDCIFDVRVTGNTGFAKLYLLSQKIEAGSTGIVVSDDKDPTKPEEPVTFTATVARDAPLSRRAGRGAPTGMVQFTLDGEKAGDPVRLDAKGQARWKTWRLKVGDHKVAAQYMPAKGTAFLASSSGDETHTVKGN
jgi:hypothetical protein